MTSSKISPGILRGRAVLIDRQPTAGKKSRFPRRESVPRATSVFVRQTRRLRCPTLPLMAAPVRARLGYWSSSQCQPRRSRRWHQSLRQRRDFGRGGIRPSGRSAHSTNCHSSPVSRRSVGRASGPPCSDGHSARSCSRTSPKRTDRSKIQERPRESSVAVRLAETKCVVDFEPHAHHLVRCH